MHCNTKRELLLEIQHNEWIARMDLRWLALAADLAFLFFWYGHDQIRDLAWEKHYAIKARYGTSRTLRYWFFFLEKTLKETDQNKQKPYYPLGRLTHIILSLALTGLHGWTWLWMWRWMSFNGRNGKSPKTAERQSRLLDPYRPRCIDHSKCWSLWSPLS